MYTTALPQRPRPPGSRRGPLRSTAGEAPPLPSKQALKLQEEPSPSRRGKGNQPDMYTSPLKRPGMRRRPLSLLSETSVLSPPPPYGGNRTLSPEHKGAGMAIPPPPPEGLESGPSSVRTSLLDTEGPLEEDEDDGEIGDTLTLRRLQKLIRQHEFETMANELQGRLVHLADSPDATLPSLFDLDATSSPQRSTSRESPHGRRLRTVPSDPGLTFSRPKPRVSSGNEARELRLAAVRAEEDANTIAQLEAALADARDGEEAQRKSAARLRRDLSRLKRDLEHAEEVITEHQHLESSMSEVGRGDRQRSVDRVAQWSNTASSLSRPRGSYGPPPEEDVVAGWGSSYFPEFPRDNVSLHSSSSDAPTEVASTVRMSSSPEEKVVSPDLPMPGAFSSPSQPLPSAPETLMPERSVRLRPMLTSTTFTSPSRDSVRTPTLTVNPPTSQSSPTENLGPVAATPRRARSLRTTGTGSDLLRESMRVRTRSFTDKLSPMSHSRTVSNSETETGLHSGSPSNSTISALSEPSRIGSVRSIFSAVVGVHQSLGSELGSRFNPTPTKGSEEAAASLDPLTPIRAISRQRHARKEQPPSSPTTTFHFRGTLESPSRPSAYDYEYPDAPLRMGPVAEDWSPQSWPTPCKPPRDPESSAPQIPELHYPAHNWEAELHTPLQHHIRQPSWPPMPGAGAGLTPSPHATTGLAPCADPWDEYSDRPTPSPRQRNLRPLMLCARPAPHGGRTSAVAVGSDRSARGAGFRFRGVVRGPPQQHPEPTPSNAVVAYTRSAAHVFAPTRFAPPPHLHVPVTIPGRITHDIFCLILVAIEYLEWFVILLYRFTLDVRAGPSGAEVTLGFKRRQHPKRFYL